MFDVAPSQLPVDVVHSNIRIEVNVVPLALFVFWICVLHKMKQFKKRRQLLFHDENLTSFTMHEFVWFIFWLDPC